MNQRRVLVVAFHYPPDNASTGVLRTLKFTQYLVRHGWLSDVLSVGDTHYVNRDDNLSRQIPETTTVYRTRATDIKKTFSIGGVYPGILEIPDRYWPWIRTAYRKGLEILDSGEYSALYATYPIASALIAGWLLKRRTGLPLIVDFRDPWVEESMPFVNRRIEGYLERKVISHADRVICNTPAMHASFIKRYPGVPPEKFVTITNGYDEPDFAGLEPMPIEKFEVLYPGVIDRENRDPEPLLAAIAVCIERGWIPRDNMQMTFLGCGPYGHHPKFRSDVERFGLKDVVSVTEQRIPYQDALRRLAGADVVAVLSEPLGTGKDADALRRWTHMQVPAKVYEYLRLGRPILALVSGGAVAELLGATQRGHTVAPLGTDRIAEILRDLYQGRSSTIAVPAHAPSDIVVYNRENLTARLAEELNKLVDTAS